jgi:hypothetical protein
MGWKFRDSLTSIETIITINYFVPLLNKNATDKSAAFLESKMKVILFN